MQKRNYIRIVGLLMNLWLCVACTQTESFFYNGVEGICFSQPSEHYALGELPLNQQTVSAKIVLERVGKNNTENQNYTLQINPQNTTVTLGKEIKPFLLNREWKSQTWNDTLEIVIDRTQLDGEKEYTLVLNLPTNESVKPVIKELSSFILSFTNRLDKPQWWNELSYWLGEFHPAKYQKYIEYSGRTLTINEIKDHKYAVLRIFKRVKSYFDEHPQPAVLFPDVRWEV